MKLAIVIPAYNEEKSLGSVLNSIPKKIAGIRKIETIVVDDGSKDRTHEIARWNKAIAVKHIVNMGVGAATRTGLEVAKQINCDIVVTFDADGQHSPNDIERIIQPIIDKEAEFVIGSRLQSTTGMPAIKIFGNWLMNFITYSVFRQWSTDSQSGLKAISRKALDSIKLHATGYEICSELIGEIRRNKFVHKEIPIQTIYTDYSKIKGQDIFNAINIFTRIVYIKLGSLK